MTRLVKVTINDFSKLAENLHDPKELKLYEDANGETFQAEIEHDGYAVIDLPDEQYIELAPGEYQLMIVDWKPAGRMGDIIIETKSDPADDTALLYRGVNEAGAEVQPPQSLSKELVSLLAKTWFETKKSGTPE